MVRPKKIQKLQDEVVQDVPSTENVSPEMVTETQEAPVQTKKAYLPVFNDPRDAEIAELKALVFALADDKKLKKYQDDNKEKGNNEYSLALYVADPDDVKVITRWGKMKQNYVNGRTGEEKQTIDLFFNGDDSTPITVAYADLKVVVDVTPRIPCISETKMVDVKNQGKLDTLVSLQYEGKTYSVFATFLNFR